MTTATFQPPKDQLGPFIKAQYGTHNTAKLVGLDKSYNAVYSRGVALVQAVTPIHKKAYYWTSASFFTGIDNNLTSYITPVRDVASAVLAGLELIKGVLSILDTLASFGINILKELVTRILDLLTSVIELFDLRGSFHMLIIPPKVGNLGGVINTDIDEKVDSVLNKNAKRSEKTRQDFTKYLSNLSNKLPEALGADVSKLVSEQNSTLAGSNYLLQTIQDKLNDVTDLARPNLKSYSSTAGVGLFLGTSAINQFIEAWGKLNALFDNTIDMSKFGIKGLPLSPTISAERINEGNKLAIDKDLDGEEFSPTQFSFVVRPVAPVTLTLGSGVSYEFQRRIIYLNKEVPYLPDYSETEFINDLYKDLNDTEQLRYIVEVPKIANARSYLTTVFKNNSYVTRRTSEFPEKIPSGKYYAIAIDIYKIPSTDPNKLDKYLYLDSPVKHVTIEDTTSNRYTSGLISARGFASITIDPSARYPLWIASEGSLALLPSVLGTLVEFINFLKATISSLLDDALSFLKILLENLATVIDVYKAMLSKIDALLELIQLLMSLTGNLGVSVMSFFGTGDSSALYSMFQEYLDPTVSSTTNFGPPQEKDIRNSKVLEESSRLQSWSDQVESDLLPEALVRTGTSYLDPTGSINVVKGDRLVVQDEELKAILGDSDPNIPSITTAFNSSYNMSPILTDEMTCAGLILLAHSHLDQNLASFRTLLDLLFSSDENATDTDQQERLAKQGLVVDLPNLDLQEETQIEESPAALFTADMKLTGDPKNSPFNFCPSD
jgi:hypothetical protein